MRPALRSAGVATPGPTDETELNWLRDRGVRIDEKGRIIVSLPIPDDEPTASSGDEGASIAELMRRDLNRRNGGSRGRRRRRAPKVSQHVARARSASTIRPSRVGRPALGDEVRVYVQTTIAPQTRKILTKRGLTMAAVLNDYARELANDL